MVCRENDDYLNCIDAIIVKTVQALTLKRLNFVFTIAPLSLDSLSLSN
jgi:hypothetical protein